MRSRVRRAESWAVLALLSVSPLLGAGQRPAPLTDQALAAMKRATKYMVETVSTNGGYVWSYTPDLSRRWGEMEAYKTMIWVQPPGTTSMGHLFLDAYRATGDRYYLDAADKAARALIWGQLPAGGWNYVVDFAGDRSLQRWYDTIGKNGWRLEEFQHYYGNATFDDDVTSDAAKLLLRMYLEELNPVYKPALDKAIDFVLQSQYPVGGWPQRYPLKHDFSHHGRPDYSSFITFNDDVVWENVDFLIQCYVTLGEQRLLDPIRRGMHVYLATQQARPQAGWGQQYTLDLTPSGARTYEPAALLPGYTAAHVRILQRFYRLTGDRKFLDAIPPALDWLERCRLPDAMTDGGRYTHPTFVEIGTNTPLFVHRTGSNVVNGRYFADHDDSRLLEHYGGKTRIDVAALRAEYEALAAMKPEEATAGSPLIPGPFTGEGTPQKAFDIRGQTLMASGLNNERRPVPADAQVKQVIAALDRQERWLQTHVSISHPYTRDGAPEVPPGAAKYASADVGDETDTSPFRDDSEREYVSTGLYIRNMSILIDYVKANRK